MSNFFLFVSALFALVISVILNGLAFVQLWDWFVIPLFPVPVLTTPYAIGIASIVAFLTRDTRNLETKDTKIWITLTGAIFRPFFWVFFGWVIVQFI